VIQPAQARALGLRPGELVRVRTEAEILSTLTPDGKLEALPFMPELARHCGKTFRVYKRADKVCDTIASTGLMRMQNAVYLENLRCDGAAHDGCQAGCMMLWKEAWLDRVVGTADHGSDTHLPIAEYASHNGHATREDIMRATRVATSPEEVFSCQATELRRATTGNIPWWDVRQYIWDAKSGNKSVLEVLRGLFVLLFNKLQGANRRFLPNMLFVQGGERYPFIRGKLTKTPRETLDLKPGDIVRVKSKEEIFKTLDHENRNRGLSFDVEMLRYCGREARVLDRVQKIIDERTGRMLEIRSDCIILEGVFCRADYHLFCSRSTYHYWREIWLDKIG
jgi:hypothetical protein